MNISKTETFLDGRFLRIVELALFGFIAVMAVIALLEIRAMSNDIDKMLARYDLVVMEIGELSSNTPQDRFQDIRKDEVGDKEVEALVSEKNLAIIKLLNEQRDNPQ